MELAWNSVAILQNLYWSWAALPNLWRNLHISPDIHWKWRRFSSLVIMRIMLMNICTFISLRMLQPRPKSSPGHHSGVIWVSTRVSWVLCGVGEVVHVWPRYCVPRPGFQVPVLPGMGVVGLCHMEPGIRTIWTQKIGICCSQKGVS